MEKNLKIDINELFEREINIFNTSYNSLNESKKILEQYSPYIQKFLDIINTYYMSLTEFKASFPKSLISQSEYEFDSVINKISNLFLSFIENQLNNLLLFLSNTQSVLFSLNQTISNSQDILKNAEEKNIYIFDNIKKMNDKYHNEYIVMINSFENLENKIIKKYIKDKYTQNKENDFEIVGDDDENAVKNCVSISKKLEDSFYNFKKDEIKQYIYEYNNNIESIMNNKISYIKQLQNCIINIINSYNEYFKNSINFIDNELQENKDELTNIDINENESNYKLNEKEINAIIFNVFNSRKYNIKFLNDNISANDEMDKNEITKKPKLFLSLEDKYNIMKEIYNYDFKSINKEEFNLEIEKEKIKVFDLSKKLFSYDKIRDIKESITDEEVKILYNLVKIKKRDDNIIYFIKQLCQFRSDGKLEMPLRVFNIINNILENCLNEIFDERNKYVKLISSITMISSTFYIIKNKEKYYLKENLKKNKIFKYMDFWNNLTVMQIEEDFKNNAIDYNSNNNYEKISKKKINDIIMAKILPAAEIMKKFEIDKDTIFKTFDELMDNYQMDEKFKETLLSFINQ